MSQEQLADAVGLAAVHDNRTLRALEDEGPIRRQRRFVTFPEWQRMRQAADFSERYLHLSPPRAGLGEGGGHLPPRRIAMGRGTTEGGGGVTGS